MNQMMSNDTDIRIQVYITLSFYIRHGIQLGDIFFKQQFL